MKTFMKNLIEKINDSDASGFGKFILYLLLMCLAFIIDMAIALPMMYIWNWLCPDLFGLPEITWIKMWGLMVLIDILFKTHND